MTQKGILFSHDWRELHPEEGVGKTCLRCGDRESPIFDTYLTCDPSRLGTQAQTRIRFVYAQDADGNRIPVGLDPKEVSR